MSRTDVLQGQYTNVTRRTFLQYWLAGMTIPLTPPQRLNTENATDVFATLLASTLGAVSFAPNPATNPPRSASTVILSKRKEEMLVTCGFDDGTNTTLIGSLPNVAEATGVVFASASRGFDRTLHQTIRALEAGGELPIDHIDLSDNPQKRAALADCRGLLEEDYCRILNLHKFDQPIPLTIPGMSDDEGPRIFSPRGPQSFVETVSNGLFCNPSALDGLTVAVPQAMSLPYLTASKTGDYTTVNFSMNAGVGRQLPVQFWGQAVQTSGVHPGTLATGEIAGPLIVIGAVAYGLYALGQKIRGK